MWPQIRQEKEEPSTCREAEHFLREDTLSKLKDERLVGKEDVASALGPGEGGGQKSKGTIEVQRHMCFSGCFVDQVQGGGQPQLRGRHRARCGHLLATWKDFSLSDR